MLDAETLQTRLGQLRGDIAGRLDELSIQAKTIPQLHYLVFEVRASEAFKWLPITIFTYDLNKVSLECELDGEPFLEGQGFLDPRNEYPVGRFDFAGMDTTDDYSLVIHEIAVFLSQLCTDDATVNGFPIILLGPPDFDWMDDDNSFGEPRQFTNITSGKEETHYFTHAD